MATTQTLPAMTINGRSIMGLSTMRTTGTVHVEVGLGFTACGKSSLFDMDAVAERDEDTTHISCGVCSNLV